MITVVNIRDKGVRDALKAGNPQYMYCGRGIRQWGLRTSKWCNPYAVSPILDRDAAIAKFRAHLMATPELLAALPELRDKVLVCWCKPLACHCDVLKELAEKDAVTP